MMRRKDFISLLIPLSCVAIAAASNILFPKCEQDLDCPKEFSCKPICNSSCNSLCVPLKKVSRHPQQSLRSGESTELDAPFAADANPFAGAQADEPSTPLTISEKELERELKKSGTSQPMPPPRFITPPESDGSNTAWTLAPGELAAGSTEQQISSPSFSPEPPGFSASPVYETTSPPANSDNPRKKSSSSSSSESKELKEPSYKSSREKEVKETSNKRRGNLVNTTPPSRSSELLTTLSHISATDRSKEGEEEKLRSTKTDLVKQALKKTKGKLSKTKKPSKSFLAIKNTPTSLADGCPSPKICAKNCGVVIDEDGCQACRCLWTSGPCSTDLDCSGLGLFCDLGRCECKSGFEHDKEPGVCRRTTNTKEKPSQQGIRLSSSAGGLVSGKSRKNLPVSKHLKKIANIHQNRARRSPPFSNKPMREERLQWPGF